MSRNGSVAACVAVLVCCLGTPVRPAEPGAGESPVVRAAAASRPSAATDRGRVRVGMFALVVLGIIAVVVISMGLFMLILRWTRRTRRLGREPVHTDMEDLWAAAGKKDLPPPAEEDEP